MAPLSKKPTKPVTKKVKKVKKKRLNEVTTKPQPTEALPPPTRQSDDPPLKKTRWTNKQRLLIFASRGITYRDRHLMEDLRKMMAHARSDSKMEKKDNLSVINEICEMKNCNKCLFFECKRKQDLYMWMSNVGKGPSAKFLVQNVYTMGELKLSGNALRGSRPLLSFDANFDSKPHYKLLREIFVQTFGTPNQHPKSQPFFDHVLTFSILDNRVWFRNYQIVSEDGSMAEIGPRFVLNPIKIFEDSFGGAVLWENPNFTNPNMYRLMLKKNAGSKYEARVSAKLAYAESAPKTSYEMKSLDDIFHGDALERAMALEANDASQECEMTTLDDDKPKKSKKKSKAKVKAAPGKVVKKTVKKKKVKV